MYFVSIKSIIKLRARRLAGYRSPEKPPCLLPCRFRSPHIRYLLDLYIKYKDEFVLDLFGREQGQSHSEGRQALRRSVQVLL